MQDIEKKIIASVIIPCFNEKAYIGTCLESILGNQTMMPHTEVIVVDGGSSDGTIEIVKEYCLKYANVRLFDNPKRIAPCAQNIGINNAQGEYLFLIDAHAAICNTYIEKCISYLQKHPNAVGVGGAMTTRPKNDTPVGRMITQAITSPFGVGNSPFRTGKSGLAWVESVYCCCYQKDVFTTFGRFNERLQRGFDFEFNKRFQKSGRKFLYIPEIESSYYARSELNCKLVRFYHTEGFWAVYPYKVAGRRYLTLSHLVPAAFVLSLIGTGLLSLLIPGMKWLFAGIAGLYFFTALIASIAAARKHGTVASAVCLPLIFALIHISYGVGSLHAFLKPKAG
jgi:glycosyltransferase involved in cell wall biosynthesis